MATSKKKTTDVDPNEMVTVTALAGVRHLDRGEVGEMPRATAERYANSGWVAIHVDAESASQPTEPPPGADGSQNPPEAPQGAASGQSDGGDAS